MRKGIKISAKVIAVAALTAIFFPLCLALLLQIEEVQNAAVDRATRFLSRKLGTEVRIGHLTLGFFNHLCVEDLYVSDLERDTLLYAGRVEASVARIGLLGGPLVFDDAVLSETKFYLKESPRGVMNIKEVVERLKPKKEKKKKNPLQLNFRTLEIEGVEFRLLRNDERRRDFGIDFSDMRLKNLWGRLSDFTIDGPQISGTLDRLSGCEHSGFRLDDLSGRLSVENGRITLTDTEIRTPGSRLCMPLLDLRGDMWTSYKYFVDSVRMEARFEGSSLSTDDIAHFAPSLRDWHLEAGEVDLEVEGRVADLRTRIRNLVTAGGSRLQADLRMRGLPDARRTRFEAKLHSLQTNAADARTLCAAITRKPLAPGVVHLLARAGGIELSGRFAGLLSDFRAKALAATSAGVLDAEVSLSADRKIRAAVSSAGMQLGALLGQAAIGSAGFSASADGTLGRPGPDLRVRGDFSHLELNEVRYDSLRLDGRVRGKRCDGRLVSASSILDFTLHGEADFEAAEPRYDVDLQLRNADLRAMRFNRRDSLSCLALHLSARVDGRSLDDLTGAVRIRDAVYRYDGAEVRTDELALTARRFGTIRQLDLDSDYADLSFRSSRGYKEAFLHLSEALRPYLPGLYPPEGEAEEEKAEEEKEAKAGEEENDKEEKAANGTNGINGAADYSSLKVKVKRMGPLTNAISEGLHVADSSRLNLLYNPTSGHLSLSLESEFIERDRLFATNLSLSAMNRGDSLLLHASAEDFYAGALHLQRIDLTGGARDNRFVLLLGFSDSTTSFAGNFDLRGRIRRHSGRRQLLLRLRPSKLSSGQKSWDVFSPAIELDSARILVDRFTMRNDSEMLMLDGVASRSREDSVRLTLRNFDLSPLTQIAASMGYRISGQSSGFATVTSALHESEISADIHIDSMRINDDLRVPPLQLLSRWDFERNRAALFIVDREKLDTVIRGFYRPSEGRYYARARLDSLRLGILDPVLKGVISDTRGTASAELVLMGERRDARLSGTVEARNLSTKVDFTQAVYRIPEVRLTVEDNLLKASRVPVCDTEGNWGELNFALDLAHLSNIGYTLDVALKKMLVLNTTSKDNDLFYGKIYASGQARIAGDKMGVKMDINASTENNSVFYMPLSGSSNVGKADFVIFESADKPDTTDYLVRKKLLFERRMRRKSRSSGAMDINLGLAVHRNLDFQLVIDPQAGDIMRGRGEGLLNLHVNPRENIFEMTGDYEIREGSYLFTLQNLINKKFLIEEGSTIQWTGEPMDAMLNVNAIYKLKASLQPLLGASTSEDRNSNSRTVPVECVIHLGDRLTNPSKSFSIRVPQADSETQTAVANILNTETTIARQFIYLLAFNSFYPESSTGSSGNIGAVASAATGFELLTNQLSNILSTDDYNIILRYRPKTEVTGDEVDFGFSSNLIDNRLIIEVEGNYVLDNSQAINSQMSNFMGEAYITWLIDRAGALRLKGFTQTIDRFDETQGLQETGIGIYYKEDFDNLKDLRRRVRERFSSREGRERRELRREERRRKRAETRTTETPGVQNGVPDETPDGMPDEAQEKEPN